jgi:hypothetical protein
MTQNLRNQWWIFHTGNHSQLATTIWTGLDVDGEDALEPLHPAHRGQRLVGVDGAVGSARHDALAMLEIRGEYPVKAR